MGDALIVCGLAFGDEGKGSVTDFLVRAHGARAVVRYNGGPQSGHNVVTADGRRHCFAQFGAGSFVPGTRTLLSPYMLVELENLAVEADVLGEKGVGDACDRLGIDPDCALVTPMHKMIGQMLEVARGAQALGSCGMGVGQAVLDRDRGGGITVRDVLAGAPGDSRLTRLAEEKLAQAAELVQRCPTAEMTALHRRFLDRCRPDALAASYRKVLRRSRATVASARDGLRRALAEGTVVFEGAQGALLDRRFGFAPYVTPSRATAHNALELLNAMRSGPGPRPTKIGVMRAYGHRHGPGPFVTEDHRLARRLQDACNPANRWQGPFRVGRLDLPALRYGIALNDGVDRLAVTGLDRLTGLPTLRLCASYAYAGNPADLDPWFEWEPLGRRRARVLGFRPPGNHAPEGGLLARVLARCRPLDWVTLPGWARDIGGVRALRDLPSQARRLLEFLAGEEGLGVPLGLVSVGPDAQAKVFGPL